MQNGSFPRTHGSAEARTPEKRDPRNDKAARALGLIFMACAAVIILMVTVKFGLILFT